MLSISINIYIFVCMYRYINGGVIQLTMSQYIKYNTEIALAYPYKIPTVYKIYNRPYTGQSSLYQLVMLYCFVLLYCRTSLYTFTISIIKILDLHNI